MIVYVILSLLKYLSVLQANVDVYRKETPLEIYAAVTLEARYEVKEAC